eukprot:comp45542_c0_seq1/m.47543 comp45542_c0_seq1/g.47543  ORF comp45542_c0_seq1/g.47543 comp45542_c0_seq1/m.47543 type:complete len:649 (-) comp45542_c0_seq1:111-2057(-)
MFLAAGRSFVSHSRRVCRQAATKTSWPSPWTPKCSQFPHSSYPTRGISGISTHIRTHTCGQLREEHVGQKVSLCGWLQLKRELGPFVFVPLRDGYGVTQVVISKEVDSFADLKKTLDSTPVESVLKIDGVVRRRPDGQDNKKMPTGSIEVLVTGIEVLNDCTDLPFPIRDEISAGTDDTEHKMRYRYLMLRRNNLQRNIRLRSELAKVARDCLHDQGFVEVETPTLFRRTPEGAREFLVPTRNPGHFYALPQSPQQYKQMLMVGAIDRYFQFARCYRDEDLRADRQPEFTQLDLEMSWVSKDDIQRVIEDVCVRMWATAGFQIPSPFPVMSYEHAMSKYGIDKPDVRFDMLIEDMTAICKNTQVPHLRAAANADNGFVGAITMKQYGSLFSRKDIDSLQTVLQPYGYKGATWIQLANGNFRSSVSKTLDENTKSAIRDTLSLADGDLVLLLEGQRNKTLDALGKLRLHCASAVEAKGVPLRDPKRFEFLWVVDFPLFSPTEDGSQQLVSTHHPFTAPVPEDEEILFTHPEKVRGQHYDLVVNGWELGGGSIRVHSRTKQERIFRDILKVTGGQFDHLLNALGHGCPPHGGIALGFDRLMAIIVGASSLREVIAFPKTFSGKEVMTGSPSTISDNELSEYGLALVGGKK